MAFRRYFPVVVCLSCWVSFAYFLIGLSFADWCLVVVVGFCSSVLWIFFLPFLCSHWDFRSRCSFFAWFCGCASVVCFRLLM